MTGRLPQFEIGKEYKRSELHDHYGGTRQAGISASASLPIIFLFHTPAGDFHGYADGWTDDGLFRYSGQGQVGDMEMLRGNAAIRDHKENHKALHLFAKSRNSYVTYVGEFELADVLEEDNVPDRRGKPRKAFAFLLRPVDSTQSHSNLTYRPPSGAVHAVAENPPASGYTITAEASPPPEPEPPEHHVPGSQQLSLPRPSEAINEMPQPERVPGDSQGTAGSTSSARWLCLASLLVVALIIVVWLIWLR